MNSITYLKEGFSDALELGAGLIFAILFAAVLAVTTHVIHSLLFPTADFFAHECAPSATGCMYTWSGTASMGLALVLMVIGFWVIRR